MKDKYDVHSIAAILFHYKKNRIDYKTEITSYIKNFPNNFKNGYLTARDIILEFEPDLIIADFESFSIKVSRNYHIPLICIDNIQTVSETYADRGVPKKFQKYKNTQVRGIKLLVPNYDFAILTSFFDPIPRNQENTIIIPGILRKEILDARKLKTKKDHILVYQTSDTNENLLPSLSAISKQKFVVYGFNMDKKMANVILKKYSSEGFIKDLSSAKAVITNGGFTLISEALCLRKPLLCNPIETQYEQIMNGVYIEKLGYGAMAETISQEAIEQFILNLKKYEKNLQGYQQKDNSELFKIVDEKIDYFKNKRKSTKIIESEFYRFFRNLRAIYWFFPFIYMIFKLPTELLFLKFKGEREQK
jgi:uncharacterized protein (TIGR00661 family)